MLFSFAQIANAQEGPIPLVRCDLTGENACTLCDLFKMVDRIIDLALFTIAPLLAVVMIAIGAFMMIMAYAGSAGPETINKAKKLFASIAIGLLIIYSAWAIVYLFLMVLGVVDYTGFSEGGWQINCGN